MELRSTVSAKPVTAAVQLSEVKTFADLGRKEKNKEDPIVVDLDDDEEDFCVKTEHDEEEEENEQAITEQEEEEHVVTEEEEQEDQVITEEDQAEDESDQELPDIVTSGSAQLSTYPKGSKQQKCPVCPQKFSIRSEMRAHVALMHYAKQIREKSRISTTTRTCPVCSVSFVSNQRLVTHLAFVHNVISKVVKNEEILKMLTDRTNEEYHKLVKGQNSEEVEEKALEKETLSMSGHVAASKGSGRLKCPLCPQTFDIPSRVRTHLAYHYAKQIREKCNISVTTKTCPLCSESLAQSRSLVGHLAFGHDVISEVEDNPEVLKWATIRGKEDDVAGEKEGDVSDEEPTEPEASSKSVHSEDLNERGRCVTCPLCPKTFDQACHLRNHVAQSHYKDKIREKCGITVTTRTCPDCHVTMVNNLSLVGHLALKHNGIGQIEENQEVLKWFQMEGQSGRKRRNAVSLPIEAKEPRLSGMPDGTS